MSPSEFDLRAALREGEGDGIDAGRLIANANRIRRDRRRRINTGLGIAAVVGVLGTFGALIGTSGGGGDSTAGGSAASRQDFGAAATRPSSNAAAHGRDTSLAPVPSPPGRRSHGMTAQAGRACPATPVHIMRPGAISTADNRLFPAHLAAISACAYPASGTTVGGAFVTGAAAQSLARALDSAPAVPAPSGACGAPFAGRGTVQLQVYDSSGTALAPVTVVPSCNQAKVTNGTVTKYPRRLPAPLPELLYAAR